MTIQKVNTSRNTATRSTYVGEKGRLFYDEANGTLYISDGRTPGGSSIFNKLVNGNYSATLDSSGNFTVPGNLTVQGTTTTVVNEIVNNNDTITGTLTVSGATALSTANITGTGQNLLLYSENFVTGWASSNSTTVTANATTNPLTGTTTASKLVPPNGATGRKSINIYLNIVSGAKYTYSIYLKAAEYSTASMWWDTTTFVEGGYPGSGNIINLSTGAVTGSGGVTTTSVGNGWYRCSITVTTTSAVITAVQIGVGATNGGDITANGTNGIYIWGAQVELAGSAGSYTTTAGTAVYNAPALSFSGEDVISLNQTGKLVISTPGANGQIAFPTGSVAFPSITFTTAQNRGIYDSNDGGIGFVGAGWEQARIGIVTNTNRYVILQGGQAGVTSPAIGTGGGAEAFTIFSNGNSIRFYTKGYATAPQMTIAALDNTVNYVQVQGNLTGNAPSLSAVGSDSTIDLSLTAKAGSIVVKNPSTQNLIGYSNTFSNGNWSKGTFVTVATTAATTDPFGGSSAWLLLADNTNNSHAIYWIGTNPWVVGAVNTLSIYVKAAGYTLVQLSDIGSAAFCARFDLSAVTATPIVGCSATITLVTNGWYRLTVTTTTATTLVGSSRFSVIGYPSTGATPNTYNVVYQGDATNGIYIYGAQAELAPTVGTYVETVSLTQIYSAPKISFNGVTTIQLSSTGALSLTPAGNGAIQAQPADGTILNGNARGSYAVDWQTARTAATQVATGTYSVIGGGYANTASAYQSGIATGSSNLAQGNYNFIGGGSNNTANGNYLNSWSVITGGYTNTANGSFNFIGGGSNNSGTPNTTVTTQTTTTTGITSGSTAVTLSTSNASIKVGQLVTGTGINGFPPTYVSAISGTTLTLSQNANATIAVASTLSFYTPHAVVVAGGNNQATGSFSFIGGGGDAGTSANGNVASGDWSAIVGGSKGVASGKGATVVGGINGQATGVGAFVGGGGWGADGTSISGNIASGNSSFIGGGYSNQALGGYSMIVGGSFNYVAATSGAVLGGRNGTDRTITGNTVFPANHNPLGTQGGCQSAILVLARQTTDATATILASDGNAGNQYNQVALPANSAYYFKGSVIAGVTGGGNSKSWTFEGAMKKGAVNSIVFVGTPIVNVIAQDAGASTWDISIGRSPSFDTLVVSVTGQAATTIRWVCKIETTEMTF